MRTFRVNKRADIVCEWKKTRNGFKHEATLLVDGVEEDSAKCCYQNRTWESFEFESVLEKLLDKTSVLSKSQKTRFLNKIQGKSKKEADSMFKSVALVAQVGDLFCDDKKEANDWKARMIKAGVGDLGLSIPDDWDSLEEDEKERRLNNVIGELRGD